MNKIFPLLFLCFSSFAFASAEEIPQKTLIKVAVPPGAQQPFWGGSSKLPSGLLHDIATLLAKHSNADVKYITVNSISDLNQAIADGRADISIIYRSQYQKNKSSFEYYPLFREAVVGWINPKDKGLHNDQLHWACSKNSAFCKILEHLDWNVINTESDKDIEKTIIGNKANATIGVYNALLYYFKNNKANNEEIYFNQLLGTVTAEIIINKDNLELNKKVKNFIGYLDKGGKKEINLIKNKYNVDDSIYKRWYNTNKKITVTYGLSTNAFPYSFINHDTGKYEGAIHDIFKKLGDLTPLNFEFVHYDDLNDQYLIRNNIIDVIPMVKRLKTAPLGYTYTSNFIDIKFTHVRNLNSKKSNTTGILDRFGYHNKLSEKNFKIYNSLEEILPDLKNGELKYAYINQQLLEELYSNEIFTNFEIISKTDSLDLNIKVPMILKSENENIKELLNDAFNMIPQSEMNNILSRYNKFEYKIGYQKNKVEYFVLFITFTILFSILFFLISLSKLKKKAEGEKKKSALSEAQTKWLFDIIDHIPNAVCINNKNKVILSNSSFKKLINYFDFKNEEHLLLYILNMANFLPNGESKRTIYLESPINNKCYDVVNASISGYLDNIDLHMLLLSDITTQKEKEKVLVDLHKASEQLLQQKKQFLAVISHELRTPISGIVGMIELLKQRCHDDIEDKMLKNALTSANKLKLLVDDILDFSKLDAEQLRITLVDTNIALDLSSVIQSFENLALRKGLIFNVDWEPSPYLSYNIDILRISQVVSNILSNAIKFTDQGLITIKIKTLQNQLTFSIVDSGIGMTPEELQVLFDPFIQAQDNIARKYGGTGLGMAIVKNLIELMNGTISVKSLPGVGTTVEITFFADSHPTPIPHIKEVLETNDPELALWFKTLNINYLLTESEDYINNKKNCYPSKVFELLEKQTLKPNNHIKEQTRLTGHVLVVEDDPLNRHVFKMQLDSLNLSSSLVNSGIEAIEFIRDNNIDVIISDYHMPEMNGIEFANYIRTSEESYAHTPIIICTADSSEEVKTHASKIGINSILYKPYSITDLIEHLNELLSYNDNLSNSPNLKSWFQKFEHGNQSLMAEAIIESLSTGVTALKDENQCTKSAAHRLKGAVGALELYDVALLCSQLESTPDNIDIKNQLLNHIESLISEAKKLK